MKLLKALTAGALALLIVGGIPYLLVRHIGNPYPPEGIALDAQLTDNAILGLLAVLVWILWAQFTLGLLLEVYAALADRPLTLMLPVFGVQQDLARLLVGAIITTTVAAPLGVGLDGAYATTAGAAANPVTETSSATGSTAPDHQPQQQHHDHSRNGAQRTDGPDRPDPAPPGPVMPHQAQEYQNSSREISVTVQRGDSLWSLAETYLDDGDRWSEIAQANSGRVMSDGTPFTSADQIRPGWDLTIPGVTPSHLPDRQTDRDVQGVQGVRGVSQGRESDYRVEAGDTLWDIAEEQLGDPTQYPRIFGASTTITQPGGTHLSDPDIIDVGWTVTIPDAEPKARPGSPSQQNRFGPRTQPGREDAPQIVPGQASDRGSSKLSEQSRDAAAPDGASEATQQAGAGSQQQRRSEDQRGGPGDRSRDSTGSDTATPRKDAGAADADTSGAPGAGMGTMRTQREDGATGGSDGQAGEVGAEQRPAWMLPGLTGGGLMLAGGLLLGLRARRRAQSRDRRPGRAVAAPPQGLGTVEKSVRVSARAAVAVEDLDVALRHLAAWCAASGSPVPALAAVELNSGPDARVVLHLSQPASLGLPWVDVAGDGTRWACHPQDQAETEAGVGHEVVAEGLDEVDAPYPLLMTVGSTRDGAVWLLNFEELAEVRVCGDAARGRDFVRYLVAELAMNPWSRHTRVDCVGIGAEVAPLAPDRVVHHDPADVAKVEATIAKATADSVRTVERAHAAGGTTPTGRSGQLDEDTWPARMLVLADENPGPGPADHPLQPGRAGASAALEQLRHAVRTHPSRSATAVLLLDDTGVSADERPAHDDTGPVSNPASWAAASEWATSEPVTSEPVTSDPAVEVRVSAGGHLVVAMVGLELEAVGLSLEEAHGCAALLAQADDVDDVEIPDRAGSLDLDGWEAWANVAGSLRREHTVSRDVTTGDLPEAADSVLSAPSENYLDAGAATTEDLEALAPLVPARVREMVENADPDLDADLVDWFDEASRRPRLQVLGAVTAHAHGKPLTKQRAYMTELLAYLTLRRRTGATPGEVATAFELTARKTRDYTSTLRSWLGENPRTGQPYLPYADKCPAARTRGIAIYQVDQDVLVDAELFYRLRLRGETRGTEGIEDLRRALLLVSGRPFDQLRVGGWAWLIDEHLDHYLSPAVADVAFLVTTHSLERHELLEARAAAEIAALAAPDEEAARLCLARVCEAEGNGVEADRILRNEVCNRSDNGEAPPSLSERSAQIIRHHRWLGTAPPVAPHPTQARTPTETDAPHATAPAS